MLETVKGLINVPHLVQNYVVADLMIDTIVRRHLQEVTLLMSPMALRGLGWMPHKPKIAEAGRLTLKVLSQPGISIMMDLFPLATTVPAELSNVGRPSAYCSP